MSNLSSGKKDERRENDFFNEKTIGFEFHTCIVQGAMAVCTVYKFQNF